MSESVDIKASGKLPDHQETESWDYYDDLDNYSDVILYDVNGGKDYSDGDDDSGDDNDVKKQPKLTVI